MNPELDILANLADWWAMASSCLHLPAQDLQKHTTTPGFHMSAGDPNSDTHTCAVNITPSVPSLQPQHARLKLNNVLSVYHFMIFSFTFYIAKAYMLTNITIVKILFK